MNGYGGYDDRSGRGGAGYGGRFGHGADVGGSHGGYGTYGGEYQGGAYGNNGGFRTSYGLNENASGGKRGDTYCGTSCGSSADAGGAPSEADLRAQMERYGNMSQEQLTAELFAQASGLRAQGKLDTAQLDAFCNLAAPYMSAEQIQRMRTLIGMLK